MLCSRRAYPGSSAASILGAVLHRAPDPLNAPPTFHDIVSRCLEKDPGRRYQSARELLQALQQTSVSERSADRETTTPKAKVRGLSWHFSTAVTAGVALLLEAALGTGYWMHEYGNQKHQLHRRASAR